MDEETTLTLDRGGDHFASMPQATTMTELEAAPGGPAPLRGLMGRALSVPLLGKLAGANLVIVLAALVGVAAERRFMSESN